MPGSRGKADRSASAGARERVPPSDQLRLFNLIVPMLRAVERRYLPPVGLSLMSVAR